MECIVCNVELKDMDRWERHMNSLSHKENVRNYSSKETIEKKTQIEDEDGFQVPLPIKPKVKIESNEEKTPEPETTTEDIPEIASEVVSDNILPSVFWLIITGLF